MGWLAGLLAVTMAGIGAGDDSIDVVVRGTLRTGIMAIGGESTGTTVTARGATWELDLRGTPEPHHSKTGTTGIMKTMWH